MASGPRELTRNQQVEAALRNERVTRERVEVLERDIIQLAVAMEKRVAALEKRFEMTEIHWPDGQVEILPRPVARQRVLEALTGAESSDGIEGQNG